MSTTDRPLVFWLSDPDDDGPEPWAAGDTVPAPPPSAGRYCLVAAERVTTAPPPPSRVRACRPSAKTDPCIVPPPGSDRMGVAEVEGRVAILPPPWAPVRGAGTSNSEGKG